MLKHYDNIDTIFLNNITSYLSGKILNDSVSSMLIMSVVAITIQLTPCTSLVFLFNSVTHVMVC